MVHHSHCEHIEGFILKMLIIAVSLAPTQSCPLVAIVHFSLFLIAYDFVGVSHCKKLEFRLLEVVLIFIWVPPH